MSVVSVPAASSLKIVPPLTGRYRRVAAIGGRAVETAVRGLDQPRVGTPAVAADGEAMERRQRPGRIELEDRAGVERAAMPPLEVVP